MATVGQHLDSKFQMLGSQYSDVELCLGLRESMKFDEKLKLLCRDRRWGQSDLIDAIGSVSKSTMNNWFNGKVKPELDSALKIARALNVPLDWLADESADYPPPSSLRPENLSDFDQAVIWEMTRTIGVEEAKRRLMRVSETRNERQNFYSGSEFEISQTAQQTRSNFEVNVEAIALIDTNEYLNTGALTICFDDGEELILSGRDADRFAYKHYSKMVDVMSNPSLDTIRRLRQHLADYRRSLEESLSSENDLPDVT